jgi:hypothetical protein
MTIGLFIAFLFVFLFGLAVGAFLMFRYGTALTARFLAIEASLKAFESRFQAIEADLKNAKTALHL